MERKILKKEMKRGKMGRNFFSKTASLISNFFSPNKSEFINFLYKDRFYELLLQAKIY